MSYRWDSEGYDDDASLWFSSTSDPRSHSLQEKKILFRLERNKSTGYTKEVQFSPKTHLHHLGISSVSDPNPNELPRAHARARSRSPVYAHLMRVLWVVVLLEWVSVDTDDEWLARSLPLSLPPLPLSKTGSARPKSPAPAGPAPRPAAAYRRPHRPPRHRRRHRSRFGHFAAFFCVAPTNRWWATCGGHAVRRWPRLTTRSAGSRPAGTLEYQCWTRSRRPRRTTCGRERRRVGGGGGDGEQGIWDEFRERMMWVSEWMDEWVREWERESRRSQREKYVC